jgi:hypothetical protein
MGLQAGSATYFDFFAAFGAGLNWGAVLAVPA